MQQLGRAQVSGVQLGASLVLIAWCGAWCGACDGVVSGKNGSAGAESTQGGSAGAESTQGASEDDDWEEPEPLRASAPWEHGQDILIRTGGGEVSISGTRAEHVVSVDYWDSRGLEAGKGTVAYVGVLNAVVVDFDTPSPLDVHIPSAFDGRVDVVVSSGSIFAGGGFGNAKQVEVTGRGSGEINLGSAATINVVFEGNAEIWFEGVSEDFNAATIETRQGNLLVGIPEEGVFSVAARSFGGGLIETSAIEAAGCTVDVDSPSLKTISCNGATDGDPVYHVATTSSLPHGIRFYVTIFND